MTFYQSRIKHISTPLVLATALLVLLGYLLLRDLGLYPTVFGDEWTYSSFARLSAFKDTLIPSYLYFSLFSLTNQCGDSFLDCARGVNALLFVGAAPAIYAVTRRVASAPVAACVALLAVCGPVNTYTAYFMPEALYFFAFWVFTALVLWFAERRSVAALVVGAAWLGLMAMVKVHALFLLPPYCVFLAHAAWSGRADGAAGARWLRRAALWIGIALVTAALVRLVGGYLFAGRHGLGLLGQMYATQATEHASAAARLSLAFDNLRGHVMALALLAGVPLASALLQLGDAGLRQRSGREVGALLVYTLLMLGALLAVTVLFTVAVSGHGSESNARLHMRYYDFTLPLLLVFAAAQAGRNPASASPPPSWQRKLLAALPAAALIVYAQQALLGEFRPGYVDSPSLFGFTAERTMFDLLSWSALAALAVWVVSMRRGAQLFVFVFTPLFVVVAADQLNIRRHEFLHADPFVKAGRFARDYLTPQEIGQLSLVGDDAASLFKTRFVIDDLRVALIIAPQRQPLPALPEGPAWLLVMGDYPVPKGMENVLAGREFTLLRKIADPGAAFAINFAVPDPDFSRVRLRGVSGQEPWGRWSNEKAVQIEYGKALPRALTLRLEANAYGPNADQDFIVRIGQHSQRVRVADQPGPVSLDFDTSGAEHLITIEVPQPVSPHKLGHGDDMRELGIGLRWLAIDDKAAP
jgi:phosphoglycerol transferase